MFSRARFVTEMMNGLPTGTESDDDDYDNDITSLNKNQKKIFTDD